MPINLPPEILELRKTYQDAQKRLLEIIANQEATGTPTAYRKRILAGVNEELRILDKYANEWVNKNVVDAYKGAMIETYQVYRDANITVPAVSFNTAVVKILTENAASKFLEAHNFVGRRIDDEIRKATVSVIAEKVSTGMTVKQVKQRLLESFADNGIKAIKDKNGKQISLDAYAEMVGRTTTREATNQGTIDEMHSVRGDLVKMSQHFSSCPVCVVYEGRVYSISGNDKRFPALYETAFKSGYNTIHPSCTHSLLPYITKYNDIEADAKNSNRPFEIRESDKKSIEDYNKRQDKKREQRIARQKWEKALVNDPTTPKTFAGYQSRQRALDKVKKKEVKKVEPKNPLYPDELAGIKRGKPMTRDEANHGKPNPEFYFGVGYQTNCQSCVVAYEARLRGYNVQTLPNTRGSQLEQLSYASHTAWIDTATGKTAEWLEPLRKLTSPASTNNILDATIKTGERYVMRFSWAGRSKTGHIISVDKTEDGILRLYDPQSGKTMTGVEIRAYLERFRYKQTWKGRTYQTPPQILRIDDKAFNIDIMGQVLEASK